ncbi:MAG: undecaprenyldiphospho-muramoylpentapeptide beta-N-acetylglucosaminyltransferase [Chitinivibrionales bacterium]
MADKSGYIVVAAGGTGGHIFPAYALLKEMVKQRSKMGFLWIGTSRSREGELSSSLGIPIVKLKTAGIKRSVSLFNILSLIGMATGFIYMFYRFLFRRPFAVVGFGGYVSAPVILAAKCLGIPYYLHEQNSVPGMVNRVFSKGAALNFLGFPLEKSDIPMKGKKLLTGTPVRKPDESYQDYEYPGLINGKGARVLICGGSQGAASMNTALIPVVEKIVEDGVNVVWQTGDYSYDRIRSAAENLSGVYAERSFKDLYPYYSWADIIICRSGASTVSEIALFGKPCILIPLPWSSENHQVFNAEYVEESGWGITVTQDDNCSERVKDALKKILYDSEKYSAMSEKALEAAKYDASSIISDKILEGKK